MVRAFDPGAATECRAVEHARQWHIDHGGDTLAIFNEPDLHSEVAVAVDETVRPIKRIDHPDARFAEAAFGVDGFFGEYAVAGKLRLQAVDDQFVRDAIGLRYGLDIVGRTLLFDSERFFVLSKDRVARRPRQVNSDS